MIRSAQILLAAFHNLSRTIGTALLFSVSERLTFGVILIEVALYHLYKVGRRDYVLWIAGLDGALKFMIAGVTHSVVKVLVDYTGMIHARGPKLAGGALFTFQTIVSQCYPFVALSFYRTSDIKDKADVNMLNTVFIVLASSWFLCVLAFLRVTKKEFWNTFTSTVTGWQFTIDSFRASDDPQTKLLTAFDNHIR